MLKKFAAFAGAFTGGITGGVLAMAMYCIFFSGGARNADAYWVVNYISAALSTVCAIISVKLGSYLYVKFGGRPDKSMLIVTGAVTVVCMVLSLFLLYFFMLCILFLPSERNVLSVSEILGHAFGGFFTDIMSFGLFMIYFGFTLVFTAVGILMKIFGKKNAEEKKDADI